MPNCLPTASRPITIHHGSSSGFERFKGTSYFIQNENELNETIIYKHIVIDVKYEADNNYRLHDGNIGRCWLVTVLDNESCEECYYYIRNWIDIVDYYEAKGFKFVEEK